MTRTLASEKLDIMKRTTRTIAALGMLLTLGSVFANSLHAQSEEFSVKVMSYNIHRGGVVYLKQPLSQTAKVIQEAQADIVGIQEPKSPKGFTTEKLASLLGWNHSANIRKGIILTPYEIVEEPQRWHQGQTAYGPGSLCVQPALAIKPLSTVPAFEHPTKVA